MRIAIPNSILSNRRAALMLAVAVFGLLQSACSNFTTRQPPVWVWTDMKKQDKYKAQSESQFRFPGRNRSRTRRTGRNCSTAGRASPNSRTAGIRQQERATR